MHIKSGFSFSRFRTQSGFLIINEMVGIAVLVISILGALALIPYAASIYTRARCIKDLVALESSILAFAHDQASLSQVPTDGSLHDQVAGGTVYPTGFMMQVGHPSLLASVEINGPTKILDYRLQSLVSTFSDPKEDPQAEYAIDAKMKCGSLQCGLAYRVVALRNNLAPLGVKSRASAFSPSNADYTVSIGFESTIRESTNACDPTSLFATGLDPNTGKVSCAKLPSKACKTAVDESSTPGVFPGVAQMFKFNSMTNALELDCQDVPKRASCDADYRLESFGSDVLIPLSMAVAPVISAGQCVLVTQRQVPWKNSPPATRDGVSWGSCPLHYVVKTDSSAPDPLTCTLSNIVYTPGTCSYPCSCGTACTTTCYYSLPPAIPTPAFGVGLRDAGIGAHCGIIIGPQLCGDGTGSGAYWSADVTLTGSCVLNTDVGTGGLPERVPARAGP